MTEKEMKLEYRKGTSDKVYNINLIEVDDGWQVNVQYGKRWNAHNYHAYPDNPTTYGEASRIYVDLINKKTKKGYVEYGTSW